MFKSRILALLLAVMCVTLAIAPDAEAKKHTRKGRRGGNVVSTASGISDPRYADIIMNPVTGEVYHSQDADAQRYPASLTKMMTLYLLFEALDKGKTTLDARLDVSEWAARQPQTNLALSAGDSIPVETAIKALVVRSANDVAVVVGEALGGDVEHFAEMMTAKAHALGMSNTVFKNPNGLPNSGQHTTARDMAKLGIALKRDFPTYYRYFSTLQFSHDGVTYYTHNRVMLRYAGVDGIKTGFVGASGFNLVTSVVRGGRPLVGVVMGGSTGAWRDNRMIQLLDQTYDTIASRGAARGKMQPGNLPLPRGGAKKAGGAGLVADAEQNVAQPPVNTLDGGIPEANETEDGGVADNSVAPAAAPAPAPAAAPSPFVAAGVAAAKPTSAAPRVVVVTPAPVQTVKVPKTAPLQAPRPAVVPVQLANPPAQGDFGWGIQVGAFSSQELADQAAQAALQTAARQLVGAKISLVVSPGTTVYRARLEHLSQVQAKNACEQLIAGHSPCFIFKATQ